MGDNAGALVPLLLLAVAFIVLIVLPMRSRARALQQTRQLQAGLVVGSEVMTTSGLYGRIASLADDTVELEVAPGVVVRWARAAIAEIKDPAAAAPVTDPDGALDTARPVETGRPVETTRADGEPGGV